MKYPALILVWFLFAGCDSECYDPLCNEDNDSYHIPFEFSLDSLDNGFYKSEISRITLYTLNKGSVIDSQLIGTGQKSFIDAGSYTSYYGFGIIPDSMGYSYKIDSREPYINLNVTDILYQRKKEEGDCCSVMRNDIINFKINGIQKTKNDVPYVIYKNIIFEKTAGNL